MTRDTTVTAQKAPRRSSKSDEAMRQNILTQISYTEIRAPVSGRIGSIPNKPGTTCVSPTTPRPRLATVNQVDPIFVSFALPQVFLPICAPPWPRAGQGRGSIDEHAQAAGNIAFVENAVDPTTGTITVKARIANADEVLWPGQFVKAEVVLGIEPDALAVPAAAVQLGQQGPYVFVVKDDNTVELRPVTIKPHPGRRAVVGRGVAAGEKIVVDGQLRLVNGGRHGPPPSRRTPSRRRRPQPRG